jgi:hypothetical protein
MHKVADYTGSKSATFAIAFGWRLAENWMQKSPAGL